MCKCGHTPEQHEVSGEDGFRRRRNLIDAFEWAENEYSASTLYTSYCKEPKCSCEIYKHEETIPKRRL